VRLALALAAVLAAVLVAVPPAPASRDGERAALAHWAMRHAFLDGPTGLYREVEGKRTPATAWPYSQALSATIALSTVPGLGRRYLPIARERVATLSRYARRDGSYAAGAGPSGDVYFDDNEWIALELLEWHERIGDRSSLATARRLFRLVVHAWDGDESHPCPGGVFWTTARGNDDRNTVTTATGALVAMRLYAATHDRSYVVWAHRMLGWVERCMAAPNGLLGDHIRLDGGLDRTQWSYNQGTAIGAYVLLYQLTGDAGALARAEELAQKSLDSFDRTPRGGEPPFFLAILFRNLLELGKVDGSPRYHDEAQAYADAIWTGLRDPRTGLFSFHGAGPETLLEQAAVVQLYALLAR
jgi:Glycosyl hydrolase family 76